MGFAKETIGDTYLYTVPAFSRTRLVEHGFTCRLGGLSKKEFSSFNVAFHVGDNPDIVIKNRKKMVRLLNEDLESLVASEQIHGHEVYVVGIKDRGRGSISYDSAIPQTDALITNVPGIILSLYFADCVPVFFLDPVHQVIALAHAGWKGTVQHIVSLTIKKMTELFGTDPELCLAAIGPSIGRCCFQVDRPVVDEFARYVDGYEEFCFPHGAEKWLLDLPGINRHLLIKEGFRLENITKSDFCTFCSNDLFFSYRKDGGRTGRQAALIMLKERSI
ncbi:MAG: peptidoglycan editing factor PgeF [Dehalobacterium sp.]